MCELKASELRIGNYVYHNHSIGMKLPAEITQGSDIDMHHEFESIPLTEEWLIKFGFEKIGYNFRKCEDNGYGLGINEFVIWFNTNKKTYSIKAINTLVEIKTVHRLQNLYLDLTGKELTQHKN